jgi:hypothetical protein
MRILVLNADYPRFLAWLYRREPGLEAASYARQMAARNDSLFGVADFYSELRHAGPPGGGDSRQQSRFQTAWAREHGMEVEAEARHPGRKPRGLQRACCGHWPAQGRLSPTDPGRTILLVIEEFNPIRTQPGHFHVDTSWRRIKSATRY